MNLLLKAVSIDCFLNRGSETMEQLRTVVRMLLNTRGKCEQYVGSSEIENNNREY